ncbi:hypothetical protein J056_004825 [Wallemia ichthyophaga EXF-994]|uniref:Protein PBN1 n=1 Tax=Wallemia ichthyophaga (strain EXF-994 / CBS 113033) TaxID=1299270 RepID=R9AFN1_WALI9|nr:uncharacterized protein J056_004825 [Wallemia ichthyophaga EXF-994]EOR01013.1 hypothetical protein J056_004825 [Wallemia ichthyophaga EXF-994]
MHFKVTLDGSGKEDCSTLTLPSSLYVDWDEISRLDRATEIVELVEGDTDVEIPQVASNQDTILRLQLYGQSITLPVHARYPLLKQRAGVSESTLRQFSDASTKLSDGRLTPPTKETIAQTSTPELLPGTPWPQLNHQLRRGPHAGTRDFRAAEKHSKKEEYATGNLVCVLLKANTSQRVDVVVEWCVWCIWCIGRLGTCVATPWFQGPYKHLLNIDRYSTSG